MFKPPSQSRHAIEVLGPWLWNKGDALMLRAVIQRFGSRYALGASLDLKPNAGKEPPYLPRIRFRPTASEFARAVSTPSRRTWLSLIKRGLILPALPRRVLRTRGFIDGRDLVALVDCSGFAYGDQWSPRRLINRTRYYERMRRQDTKLIMLPQALGPFTDPLLRTEARRMFEQFEMIFPRDSLSESHVLGLGIHESKVTACPDISHLVEGNRPSRPEDWSRRVAIVPNARMVDRTEPAVAERYLYFLKVCVDRVRANGLEPFILLHEANDDALVDRLLERLPIRPPVIDDDGVTSKGYLGSCYANIGSRYHSLVSSLCQATPSLGTSWAHKYEALFEEYGCEDHLVSPELAPETIARKIDAFLVPRQNERLRDLLEVRARAQKAKVEAMWQRIEKAISPPHGLPRAPQ